MGALVWRRNDDGANPNLASQSQSLPQPAISQHQFSSSQTQAVGGQSLKRPAHTGFAHLPRGSSGQAPHPSGPRAPRQPHAAVGSYDVGGGARVVGSAAGAPSTSCTGPHAASDMAISSTTDHHPSLRPPHKRPRCDDSAATASGPPGTSFGHLPTPATAAASRGIQPPYTGVHSWPNPGRGPPPSRPRGPMNSHGHSEPLADGGSAVGGSGAAGRAASSGPSSARWTTGAAPQQGASGVSRTPEGATAEVGSAAMGSAAVGSGPRRRSAGSAGAGASAADDPAARLAETEAALDQLRRELAAKEAAVRAKQSDQAARQATELARKAEQRAEAAQRAAQLRRGLAALAESAAPASGGEQGAGAAGSSVRLAGPEDVRRVLRAVSDYEVLQLPVGCTAAEVRRAYRRLAAALHPDKCRQEGAQEAFIRATAAYNGLLRRSGC